jgi:hypothetical protein
VGEGGFQEILSSSKTSYAKYPLAGKGKSRERKRKDMKQRDKKEKEHDKEG